jgi:hypothetical protein
VDGGSLERERSPGAAALFLSWEGQEDFGGGDELAGVALGVVGAVD